MAMTYSHKVGDTRPNEKENTKRHKNIKFLSLSSNRIYEYVSDLYSDASYSYFFSFFFYSMLIYVLALKRAGLVS